MDSEDRCQMGCSTISAKITFISQNRQSLSKKKTAMRSKEFFFLIADPYFYLQRFPHKKTAINTNN